MNDIFAEIKEAEGIGAISMSMAGNVRSALLERDSLLVRYTEQILHLLDTLNDWSESYRKIIADEGCPDEVHCSCVPALRDEIQKLKTALQKYADRSNWNTSENPEVLWVWCGDDGYGPKLAQEALKEHKP